MRSRRLIPICRSDRFQQDQLKPKKVLKNLCVLNKITVHTDKKWWIKPSGSFHNGQYPINDGVLVLGNGLLQLVGEVVPLSLGGRLKDMFLREEDRGLPWRM